MIVCAVINTENIIYIWGRSTSVTAIILAPFVWYTRVVIEKEYLTNQISKAVSCDATNVYQLPSNNVSHWITRILVLWRIYKWYITPILDHIIIKAIKWNNIISALLVESNLSFLLKHFITEILVSFIFEGIQSFIF